jgi:2-desacetyl-2-hydroxyethyl bacteriochlorophyllide A dehydrogenase
MLRCMRAVVISEPGRVEVATVPDPAPAPDEVIVAVGGCGICGTDRHLVEGGLPDIGYPLIPGHEFFGSVVGVGGSVSRLMVGDWVAVNPNLPCGTCTPCRNGRSNLCQNYAALGVTTSGACAEYVGAPERACHRLPEDYPLESAALIEPMSCVIHGFDRLPRRPSDTYLVYGAGTVGLLMANLAQGRSDDGVCLVEPSPDRRQVAASFGLEVAATADEFDQPGWDVVIDCSGSPAAIADALERVAPGGVLLLFGVASPEARVEFRPYDVYRREITILGSMAVLNSFERAIPAIGARRDFAAQLISHRLSLEDYSVALDTFSSGTATKIVITPQP